VARRAVSHKKIYQSAVSHEINGVNVRAFVLGLREIKAVEMNQSFSG